MSYIIYRRSDSRIYINRQTEKKYYATLRAVKAAYTRLQNDGKIDGNEYAYAEAEHYRNNIEQMKTVKSLMTGEEVQISVNTPLCADPSSETYWSI